MTTTLVGSGLQHEAFVKSQGHPLVEELQSVYSVLTVSWAKNIARGVFPGQLLQEWKNLVSVVCVEILS
jgi:hypothetical protein